MKRKITSILAADVVEFSRLVSEDEEDTLARLVSAQAVFGAHVSSHGGRIFNTAGDAILAEFPSAVEAVRAALAIQQGWSNVDNDVPDDRRLWFRMGIGIGDVMEHGADLLGDGVNVASRLQALAPPGGLAVSHWVKEQISGKLSLPLIDIGDQNLKNIPKPVQVSIVDPAGFWPASAPLHATPSSFAHNRTRSRAAIHTGFGIAAALAVAAAAVYGLRPKRPIALAIPPPPIIDIGPSPPVIVPVPTVTPTPPPQVPPTPARPPPATVISTPPIPAAPTPAVAPTPPVAPPTPVDLAPASIPAPQPARPERPIAAPPVIIDPPDFAPPPPAASNSSAIPAPVSRPQPEVVEQKRMPIRPPVPEPKRMPSIEKKPAPK